MRIFNKLVFSKKEPYNKNDIWFDGKEWKVFIEGEWKDTSKFKEDATTPDWNAQEGEPGYIENKPFYAEGDIRQIDVDGEYTIQAGKVNIGDRIDISWDLEYYDGEILRGSASFVIEEGVYTYYEKDNFNIYVSDYNFELYAHGFSGGESHYGKVTVVVNGGEIKTLDEKYLPNTVLKTTPQSLSSTDKNQALTNLGIDPIVWKYLCNPHIIKVGNSIPDELLNEFGALKYYLHKSMYLAYNEATETLQPIEGMTSSEVYLPNGKFFYVGDKVWEE